MHPVPLLRVSVLGPLFGYLEAADLPCEGNVALARARLRDPLALIPLAYGGALWDEASRASGLDDLGLRVGAATRPEDVGGLGAVVRRAATVGAAMRLAVHESWRFNTGERYRLVGAGNEVTFEMRLSRALRSGRCEAYDFLLAIWIELIRLAIHPGWRPLRIHFEHAASAHDAARAALAPEVRFAQPSTALVLPEPVLLRALPALARERTVALERDDSAPNAIFPDPGFEGSARQLVGCLLELGPLDVARAARAAGASVRTFQRRLSVAGLSFSQLVEEARFEAARRMLRDPSTRIIEISGELGYTDAANFTRAFRRWTGLSPRAFRRSPSDDRPSVRA